MVQSFGTHAKLCNIAAWCVVLYTLYIQGGARMGERKMTPIRIPAELLQAIDQHVGPRQRSQFIIEASERELMRRKQLQALEESAGAWADSDYPELPDTVEGLREHLRKLRTEAERGEPS